MVLTISINADTEIQLRERARAAGKEISVYVSQLVEEAAVKAGIEELLAPLRQEFARSGITDEQLVEEITQVRALYRADQKKSA